MPDRVFRSPPPWDQAAGVLAENCHPCMNHTMNDVMDRPRYAPVQEFLET